MRAPLSLALFLLLSTGCDGVSSGASSHAAARVLSSNASGSATPPDGAPTANAMTATPSQAKASAQKTQPSATTSTGAETSKAPRGPRSPANVALRRRLQRITRGRYMEGRCKKASHRGWEGFPLRRCRYSVPDVTGHKATHVIMLNPSAKQLADWISTACGERGAPCLTRLSDRILYQSSAQFPVAGIVLEDIRPADKHYEMYCFRDGVRVEVEGFETRSTARPTEDHDKTCLEGRLIRPTSFARVAGTTPDDYRAAGGTRDVGVDGAPRAEWLDVTRTLYQRAWRSRRNALLDAWVARHIPTP